MPSRATRDLRPSSPTTRRALRRLGCGAPTGPGFCGLMRSAPRSLALPTPESCIASTVRCDSSRRPLRSSGSEKRCRRPGRLGLKDCAASAPVWPLRSRVSVRGFRWPMARRQCWSSLTSRPDDRFRSANGSIVCSRIRHEPLAAFAPDGTFLGATCGGAKTLAAHVRHCPRSGSLRPHRRRWPPAAPARRRIKATLACGVSAAAHRASCWPRSVLSRALRRGRKCSPSRRACTGVRAAAD